ncbi:MAG: AsmA family protein [Gammaproteobacteria bacterium]|nr:AsmA family protein [Gammaproteobacteria bacterium]
MKALLRLILGAIGLVLVAAIGIGVFVATLDPNDHKEWITSKVQEETGRKLALDGDIRLDLYPWIDLEVNNLTLANAPGFGDAPFLHLDYLNLRVKLIPLLQEKYEVDTVKVTGAQVNLARNKEGVTNWADLVKGGAEEARPLPLTAIVLGGVDVQKAQLTWSDAVSGAQYKVKDLTFTTGKLVYGEPINLNLVTSAEANQPAISSDLKLTGIVQYDLDAGRYSVEPLSLDGVLRSKQLPGGQTPVSLNAALSADLAKDTAAITGLKFSALKTEVVGELRASGVESGLPALESTLDVKGEDLALLFKVLEVEPLASQLAGLTDRKFSLKTNLQADLARADANFSEINAQLLGATVKGELKAANIRSETPSFKGTLNAAGPNLPMLMRVAGQMQGGKSPLARAGNAVAGFPQREFRVDTTFDADLKNGDIALPKLSASLLGADINAQLTARNAKSKTPSVKGSFSAAGADLPVLMLVAGEMQGRKDSALATYGRKLGRLSDKKFEIKAEFDADFKNGNVSVPALSAQALGVAVSGNLDAKGMSGTGGSAAGKVSVTGAQLKGLLTALDQPGLGETLRSLKFDAGIAGTGSDIALKPMVLEAVVVSEEVGNKPVNIDLRADTQVNLDTQKLRLDALSVQGLGLDVKGDFKADQILDAPVYDGGFKVAQFNLRKFMRQLKLKPPQAVDQNVLQKVALQSEISGSATDVKLSKLSVQLDDTQLQGQLSVQNFAKPVVRFGIDVDQIDLDRYLPPKPAADEGEAVAAPAAGEGEKPGRIPANLLRKLDVQGNIAVGHLVVSKARLNQVKVSIKGKDGIVKLDPIAAKLYQGTHAGNITMDVTGKVPKLTINSKIAGVQAEPLLKDMTGKAKARGTANFSAALIAAGSTAPAIKRTLNGQMSFSVQNGAIKGYNLGKIMRQGKSLKDNFSLKVSEQEETDLSEITGNPVATNGVITLDDLKGAGPGVRLSGKGVVANLPTNSLDYKLTATLVASSKGQGGQELQEGKLEGVPLDCKFKGSLDDPKRDCDATKLLAAMGVKLLESVLGLPGKLVPGGDKQAAPTTQQKQPAKKQTTEEQSTTTQKQSQDPVKDLTKGLKDLFKKEQ